MKVVETAIKGVLVFEPKVWGDSRGYFFESWHRDRYREFGLPTEWAQDNVSRSAKGVLRGLHFQNPNRQGKLVSVLDGLVYDVAVDIRPESATYGGWFGIELSAANHKQLWIPPGLAHGFVVVSESALFSYKCTEAYNPKTEHTILWNDPEIGIAWPVATPSLSDKDQKGLRLRDVPREDLA
jgi:dTDP-4-dehydrorhamnose 3,5-epimerase